jgi:2-hydroxychromene-2-carboxylate isomerase
MASDCFGARDLPRPEVRTVSKTIEFFFDFGSPTAYLAHTQLPAIAARTGAELVYRPMLLGGVFQAIGNTTPAALPAKGKYMGRDIQRCAERYGAPYHSNPHFPVNTLNVMRGAVAAQKDGAIKPYMDAVYRAIWVDQKNTADPEVIGEVISSAGLDVARFAEQVQDPTIKDGLKANTQEAVERGVFGAPTMFVGEEMFFGQDRLAYVEQYAGD